MHTKEWVLSLWVRAFRRPSVQNATMISHGVAHVYVRKLFHIQNSLMVKIIINWANVEANSTGIKWHPTDFTRLFLCKLFVAS